MTDQLTDEALAKRAEEIAKTVLPADTFTLEESFPDGWYSQDQSNRMNSYKFATLDALKVHRDGLRVLEECRDAMLSNDVHGWVTDLDKHINSLKQLLGVSQ